jgi:hypothetical protein
MPITRDSAREGKSTASKHHHKNRTTMASSDSSAYDSFDEITSYADKIRCPPSPLHGSGFHEMKVPSAAVTAVTVTKFQEPSGGKKKIPAEYPKITSLAQKEVVVVQTHTTAPVDDSKKRNLPLTMTPKRNLSLTKRNLPLTMLTPKNNLVNISKHILLLLLLTPTRNLPLTLLTPKRNLVNLWIFSPIQVISPKKRKRRRSGKSLVCQILTLLFHRLPWMNPRQPLQVLLPLQSPF